MVASVGICVWVHVVQSMPATALKVFSHWAKTVHRRLLAQATELSV